MEITPIQITIADLTKNYKDDGDGGVFGYDWRLTIRPSFQREFHFLSAHSISLLHSTRIYANQLI